MKKLILALTTSALFIPGLAFAQVSDVPVPGSTSGDAEEVIQEGETQTSGQGEAGSEDPIAAQGGTMDDPSEAGIGNDAEAGEAATTTEGEAIGDDGMELVPGAEPGDGPNEDVGTTANAPTMDDPSEAATGMNVEAGESATITDGEAVSEEGMEIVPGAEPGDAPTADEEVAPGATVQ